MSAVCLVVSVSDPLLISLRSCSETTSLSFLMVSRCCSAIFRRFSMSFSFLLKSATVALYLISASDIFALSSSMWPFISLILAWASFVMALVSFLYFSSSSSMRMS